MRIYKVGTLLTVVVAAALPATVHGKGLRSTAAAESDTAEPTPEALELDKLEHDIMNTTDHRKLASCPVGRVRTLVDGDFFFGPWCDFNLFGSNSKCGRVRVGGPCSAGYKKHDVHVRKIKSNINCNDWYWRSPGDPNDCVAYINYCENCEAFPNTQRGQCGWKVEEKCVAVPKPCDSSPCRNGGTCTNLSGGSYRCNCRSPYYGSRCQLMSDFKCFDDHLCRTASGGKGESRSGKKGNFDVVKPITKDECLERCKNRSWCHGVEYRDVKKACELWNDSLETTFPSPGGNREYCCFKN